MERLHSTLHMFLVLALVAAGLAQPGADMNDMVADSPSDTSMNETMANITEVGSTNMAVRGPNIRTSPLLMPTALPGTAAAISSTGPPPGSAPLTLRLRNCTDVPPGTRHTCAQQRQFGKCNEDYIVKFAYCSKTCGHPPCCYDKPPPGNYSCEQQKAFGKCDTDFMVKGGYCAKSCMREPCPTTEPPSPKNATRPLAPMFNTSSMGVPANDLSTGNKTAKPVDGSSGVAKKPASETTGAPPSMPPITTGGMFTP